MIKYAAWRIFIALLVVHTPAIAQQCGQLEGRSAESLVSYLSGVVPDQRNAPCVAFALGQLGTQQYAGAAPILTKFLEFRWPLGARQKQRLYVIEHDGSTIYPAADALEQIGKDALPAILAAIKSNSISRQSLDVAVSVWMTIYKNRGPVGVAMLKHEGNKTNDPGAAQRLQWAAVRAAHGWCSPSEKAQCNAVLNSQY
jgi:hypothetical protein